MSSEFTRGKARGRREQSSLTRQVETSWSTLDWSAVDMVPPELPRHEKQGVMGSSVADEQMQATGKKRTKSELSVRRSCLNRRLDSKFSKTNRNKNH